MPPARTQRTQHQSSLPESSSSTRILSSAVSSDLPRSSPPSSSDDANGSTANQHAPTSQVLVTKRGRNKPQLEEDPTLSQILMRAQFIRQGIDLWVNVPQAINVGLANDLLELYNQLDEGDEGYDEEQKNIAEEVLENCGTEKDALVKAYKGIMRLLEPFKEYIDKLDEDRQWVFWRKVNKHADQGRNNDTCKIKMFGHEYVLKVGQPVPHLSSNDDKSGRGVNHPQLLRMIVPMSVLNAYGEEPSFDDDAKAKLYTISHKSYLALLFDVDNYNAGRPEATLLRGYYPVRVCRAIFTSPSSALALPGAKGKATRPGNAMIAGQKTITPEMIAYSCIQARFFISKQKVFGEFDEKFDNKTFYYQIIKLFGDGESSWAKDTLDWWNKQLFGEVVDNKEEEEEEDSGDETSFANLLSRVSGPVDTQTQPDPQYPQDAFDSL